MTRVSAGKWIVVSNGNCRPVEAPQCGHQGVNLHRSVCMIFLEGAVHHDVLDPVRGGSGNGRLAIHQLGAIVGQAKHELIVSCEVVCRRGDVVIAWAQNDLRGTNGTEERPEMFIGQIVSTRLAASGYVAGDGNVKRSLRQVPSDLLGHRLQRVFRCQGTPIGVRKVKVAQMKKRECAAHTYRFPHTVATTRSRPL